MAMYKCLVKNTWGRMSSSSALCELLQGTLSRFVYA
jgi:hypothetical protein